MQRYCTIFYCDKRGDRYCCTDCAIRSDCRRACLNDPSRCRCEDAEGMPARRRGGSGKLPPIYNKRK